MWPTVDPRFIVIPAKGVQRYVTLKHDLADVSFREGEIPAFAGMTVGVDDMLPEVANDPAQQKGPDGRPSGPSLFPLP